MTWELGKKIQNFDGLGLKIAVLHFFLALSATALKIFKDCGQRCRQQRLKLFNPPPLADSALKNNFYNRTKLYSLGRRRRLKFFNAVGDSNYRIIFKTEPKPLLNRVEI